MTGGSLWLATLLPAVRRFFRPAVASGGMSGQCALGVDHQRRAAVGNQVRDYQRHALAGAGTGHQHDAPVVVPADHLAAAPPQHQGVRHQAVCGAPESFFISLQQLVRRQPAGLQSWG